MQAERLAGLFAYFVEDGTTVDSQVVSYLIKPDNAPTTNWNSLGTALPGFAFAVETQDDSFMAPQPGGGYRKQERMYVTGDTFSASFREQNELVHRIEMGTAAALVAATAQAPHTTTDRKVLGWLHLEARILGGSNLFMLDWWVEARLDALNREDKATPIKLAFRKLEAPGNSIVMLP